MRPLTAASTSTQHRPLRLNLAVFALAPDPSAALLFVMTSVGGLAQAYGTRGRGGLLI